MTAAPPPPATLAPADELRSRLVDLASGAGPVALRGAIAVLEALEPVEAEHVKKYAPGELAIGPMSEADLLRHLTERADAARAEPAVSMEEVLRSAEELAFEKLAAMRS